MSSLALTASCSRSTAVAVLASFIWTAGCAASDTGGTDVTGVGGNGMAQGGETASGGATKTSAFGGGTTTAQGGRSATSGGTTSTGVGGASTTAPTWSQLWTNYFSPACASCHQSSGVVGGSLVFANAAQLCTVLTTRRQLNATNNPPLISTTQSVLNWFNPRGSMPEGSTAVPGNAVADIKAWAAAGAICP